MGQQTLNDIDPGPPRQWGLDHEIRRETMATHGRRESFAPRGKSRVSSLASHQGDPPVAEPDEMLRGAVHADFVIGACVVTLSGRDVPESLDEGNAPPPKPADQLLQGP